jgi:hypothetical protein
MGGPPVSDVSGEIDFGTLDVMQVDGNSYTLSGTSARSESFPDRRR